MAIRRLKGLNPKAPSDQMYKRTFVVDQPQFRATLERYLEQTCLLFNWAADKHEKTYAEDGSGWLFYKLEEEACARKFKWLKDYPAVLRQQTLRMFDRERLKFTKATQLWRIRSAKGELRPGEAKPTFDRLTPENAELRFMQKARLAPDGASFKVPKLKASLFVEREAFPTDFLKVRHFTVRPLDIASGRYEAKMGVEEQKAGSW